MSHLEFADKAGLLAQVEPQRLAFAGSGMHWLGRPCQLPWGGLAVLGHAAWTEL